MTLVLSRGDGFHIKAAGLVGERSYFAAKTNANFPKNPERFGRPTIQGTVVLADADNGEPLAVVESGSITSLRTGAATAVAAKFLAPGTARTATIVGCGVQGAIQLAAVAAVVPLDRAWVVDQDPARAESLAARATASLGIPVEATKDLAAALAALLSPLGAVAILLLAGAIGLFLFHSKRAGAVVLTTLALGIALTRLVTWSPLSSTPSEAPLSLARLVGLFSTIGAFTFGGGLSMIARIEEHIVNRLQWLTPREFIAGLALGQLTPGPLLMVAAHVGYKLLGVTGAVAAAAAAFLPSFALMLAILPAFDRVRQRVGEIVMQETTYLRRQGATS